MNQFQLPGCLIIEEGACERLNEILADCIPGIEEKKIVIATEESLIPIMKPYLDEMKRDLPESELYLIDENSFDEAMELASFLWAASSFQSQSAVYLLMVSPIPDCKCDTGAPIITFTSTTICSGSEHLFCHSLEENHREIQISHGMAVALGSLVHIYHNPRRNRTF